MKTTLIMAVAMLIAGSGLAPDVAQAQQPGTKRTDLQRHDLSFPDARSSRYGRLRLGICGPRHTHFGEEIIYVLEARWSIPSRQPAEDLQSRRRSHCRGGAVHS